MDPRVFDELYKRLNPEQKRAVDTIEGPVMVIAGPGTGKTSILTLRIANIIRTTDTAPENILALTFTESGAHAMRKKLVSIVGTAAYKVTIATFHGFANSMIAQYPERFPRIIGSTAITDVEQTTLIETIIRDEDVELLRPYGDPLYYVRPVMNEIRNLKREAISPDTFEAKIAHDAAEFDANPDKIHAKGAHKGKMKGEFLDAEKQIAKNKELALVYHAYEKALAKQKLFDFEDMIVELVRVLSDDEDFRLILQETYQYILADEHQDANSAQNAILELLSSFHQSPNLFIVGDEKQAIYRFQGASLANFLYFKKLYPDAAVINLSSNYRSSQYILDASHSLIGHTESSTDRVRLMSKGSAVPDLHIDLYEFSKYDYEYIWVAQDIARRVASGTSAEEIAVLYRNNGDAFAVAAALDRAGVPFRIESDQDILKHPDIRSLVELFALLGNLADTALWAKVLFTDFLGLEPLEVCRIAQAASHERIPLYDMLQSPVALVRAGITDPARVTKIIDLYATIERWSKKSHTLSFLELFEYVLRDSGFLQYIVASDNSLDRLSVLDAFFGQLRKMAGSTKDYRLTDFLSYVKLVEEHGLLVKGAGSTTRKGVRLMTAHKSKGLEFEHVYIIGVYDKHWGNTTQRKMFHLAHVLGGTTGHIDDERRLFYVALTRAKQSVTLSFAREGVDGREQLPAQFIDEIDPTFVRKIPEADIKAIETKIGVALTHHTAEPHSQKRGNAVSALDPAFIIETLLAQGLAVTALNNYLKCAWEYFFVNLVRLPQAKSRHQMYGTAVHETLRLFFNKYREDETMPKKDFLALFAHNLARQPLSQNDFEESLTKGQKALGGYYDTYVTTWNRNLITEFSVAGIHLPIELDAPITLELEGVKTATTSINLLLKGQLDKLEIVDGDNAVNVVDYKTGKPKSRNDIEGLTKTADGNYKRQLTFYRLLLDRDERKDHKRYRFVSGELDFIEPIGKTTSTEKGAAKYSKERFEISDKEVAELETVIARVVREIISGDFVNHGCDDAKCEYCALGKRIAK